MPQRRTTRKSTLLVEAAVERALGRTDHVVLAVSGGRDSMVMLAATATVARHRIAAVATFDHATGPHATAACDLVEHHARALDCPTERGRAPDALYTESAWRDARWRFLRSVATRYGSRVATAHTMDDQVETVLMRALRGAGARGLAGQYAESPTVKPLLPLARQVVADYAASHQVPWHDDPSNASPRFLRNRVRRDLLPALERACPGVAADLLTTARRAAAWRADVDRWIDRCLDVRLTHDELAVAVDDLRHYDAPWLASVWPALAGRAGLTLDRRGTRRLSEFTITGPVGGRVPLSGGYEVIHHRGWLRLRPELPGRLPPFGLESRAAEEISLLTDALVFGTWRFRHVPSVTSNDRWTATLPGDVPLEVRAWQPGDRMVPLGASAPRRLKGLFRDAGVDRVRRRHWPVVLAANEIVWVPGVRRAGAAAARSGRPFVTYSCERITERDGG
jgi:tRNA(Ile)-lysidine synthase